MRAVGAEASEASEASERSGHPKHATLVDNLPTSNLG